MARMEILTQNQLDTTTQVKVDSGTATVENSFDRNLGLTYETVGFDGTTATVFSIELASATVISNLILQNHNMKVFRVFFNSATANTFTPDINETTNSATSSYFLVTSVTVNSIQLQMGEAITAGTEKSFGEFIMAERRVEFERNPSTKDFKPRLVRTKVAHKMPDGGIIQFNIKDKFRADLKWKFITTSFKNELRTVFTDAKPFYFLSFPTTGSDWDGEAFEVEWTNEFNFVHGDNAKTQGFNGNIKIQETSNA